MEKISIIGLKGKEKTEAVKKLTDNGKKELKELTLHYGGKPYNAVIIMDFQLLRKAMSALINTDVSGGKKNANVSVSIDDLGAGGRRDDGPIDWHDADGPDCGLQTWRSLFPLHRLGLCADRVHPQ